MTVEIPTTYAPVVQRLITEGRFHNETELIAEGLRLVVVQEEMREQIQAGLDDLDAGNRIAAEAVYGEARRRIREVENSAKK